MLLRLSATAERLQSSLFLVPMLCVFAGLALGLIGIRVDNLILDNGTDLPFNLTSTVDSARAILSTVAGATITVAGIAFSISLLIIQLASSQYSPRVVPGLFRDPFNKWIMGIVVGTFTYCLVVLRAVRGPLEDGGEPVIPVVSVAFAALMGVVSILAIVAFINHNAHSMDVSRILHDVTSQALHQVRQQWQRPGDQAADQPEDATPPVDVLVVHFQRHGWLQHLDLERLSRVADAGGVVRLETAIGRYAVAGTPLCTVWPRPDDVDAAADRAERSLVVGETRTSSQDVSYGIRQLADVALKALSPGINDPTTAQDAMFHLGSVLRELLGRRPPSPRQAMSDGRTLILAETPTPEYLVGLGFDEVRIAANDMPTVLIYLLEILHLLVVSLDADDLELCGDALHRQARLIRDGAASSTTLLPADIRRVVDACDARFRDLAPAI